MLFILGHIQDHFYHICHSVLRLSKCSINPLGLKALMAENKHGGWGRVKYIKYVCMSMYEHMYETRLIYIQILSRLLVTGM